MQDPAPHPCPRQGMAGVAMADPAEIARYLHDGLAQQLAFALIQLDAAQDPQHPQRDAVLRQSRQLVKTCLATVRDTVHHLHTGQAASKADLAGQLRAQYRELLSFGHGQLVLDCPDEIVPLPDTVVQHLVRACRELLINARKHAQGASTCLSVRVISDASLLLTVGDNGPGFDSATLSHSSGFGLRDLPAYLAAIGAEFRLHSRPGAGVWAQIRWQADTADKNLGVEQTQAPEEVA